MGEVKIELIGLEGGPDLQTSFEIYRLGWMTQPSYSYNSTLIWDFYASYASMIYRVTLAEGRVVEQPYMTHTFSEGEN